MRRLLRLGVKVLAPDVFLRQLAAVIVVISLRRTLWYGRKLLRAFYRNLMPRLSPQARLVEELRRKRRACRDFASFHRIGEELDRAQGLDKWKKDDNSPYFDAQRLRERTTKYKELMERGDVEGCLFSLRQELLRKHFGVCNPRLFEVTNAGTKVVVERYVDTVCEAMTWAAFEHHENLVQASSPGVHRQVTVQEKIAFFSETKHSFGRCALLLSGGAKLGMYHFGVVKALHQTGLLPRIISGTSAGSIVCGMVCAQTDEELQEMWPEDFDWEANFNLTFFGDMDWGRFFSRRGEALLSSEVLARALRDNIGELTFLEAFDRTGRICNMSVSGLPGNTELPMLLNYLTSPHVLIWSAALASAAVPGIFEPRELLMKDREGNIVPYYPGGLRWRDGSMQNDLPMHRLTEMFNVNFFIVSQVNPHAMLMTGLGLGSNRGPVFRVAQFLRRELKQYLLSVSDLFRGTAGRVSPWLRPVGWSAVGLLVQAYEGDITIFNGNGIMEMPNLLENGSTEMLRRFTSEAQRETWWSIPQIENSCKIEFVMEEILKQLREEILRKKEHDVHGGGGLSNPVSGHLIKRMISKDMGLKRLPSFHRDVMQQQKSEEMQRHSSTPLKKKTASLPHLAARNQSSSGLAAEALFEGITGNVKRSSHLFASNQSLMGLLNPQED